MIPTLARFILRVTRPHAKPRKPPSLKDLQKIRSSLLLCLEDCESLSAERLRYKISVTKTPQDLWQLRNDAYQIISQQHSQTMAAERINEVMHRFEGWVDQRQLIRIK